MFENILRLSVFNPTNLTREIFLRFYLMTIIETNSLASLTWENVSNLKSVPPSMVLGKSRNALLCPAQPTIWNRETK